MKNETFSSSSSSSSSCATSSCSLILFLSLFMAEPPHIKLTTQRNLFSRSFLLKTLFCSSLFSVWAEKLLHNLTKWAQIANVIRRPFPERKTAAQYVNNVVVFSHVNKSFSSWNVTSLNACVRYRGVLVLALNTTSCNFHFHVYLKSRGFQASVWAPTVQSLLTVHGAGQGAGPGRWPTAVRYTYYSFVEWWTQKRNHCCIAAYYWFKVLPYSGHMTSHDSL